MNQTSEILQEKDEVKKLIPPLSLSKLFSKEYDSQRNIPLLKNRNCVGIVRFNNCKEPRFYQDLKLFKVSDDLKVESDLLLNLLSYTLRDTEELNSLSKAFFCSIEPNAEIELSEGSFIEFIYPLFRIELSKLIKYGIYKQYVEREDNLIFMKGKIDIKKHKNNLIKKNPRIACRYFDLTSNIYLNQIILSAINKAVLSTNIPLLSSEFIFFRNIFRQESIDEMDFTIHEINNSTFIPKRYEKIINIAKYILQSKHVKLTDTGYKVKSPSFIIRPEVIWECFLRSIVRNIFKKKPKYNVEKIKNKMEIFEGQVVVSEEPDILILKNNKILHVIDAKYKQGWVNPDMYQIAAYIGSADRRNGPSEKVKGFLFYLGKVDDNNEWINTGKEILRNEYILSENRKLPLIIGNLFSYLPLDNDFSDFEETIERIICLS